MSLEEVMCLSAFRELTMIDNLKYWARKREIKLLKWSCVDGRIEITWQELDLYSDRLLHI